MSERVSDDLQDQVTALFAEGGAPRAGDERLALRLAGAAADRLQARLVTTFAREATPQPQDDSLGAQLAEVLPDDVQARVVESFAVDGRPQPGDDTLARRLVERSLTARPPVAAPPSERGRRVRPRGVRWAAAPVLVLASSLAVASTWVALRALERPSDAIAPTREARRPGPRKPAPSVMPVPVPAIEAPASAEKTRARPAPPSAEQLFSRANRARRSDDLANAERLYQTLQARHPRSTEARLSHLSQADVLLQRNRPAAALAQLNAYLAKAEDGNLVEEAMYRKARTLETLGQKARARTVWRGLVERFPRTVYREEAERKLAR